ncbi:MAG TPA: hypothetical protein VIH64_14155, partial [Streptosporangiaceae bacterium]
HHARTQHHGADHGPTHDDAAYDADHGPADHDAAHHCGPFRSGAQHVGRRRGVTSTVPPGWPGAPSAR